MDTTKRNRYSLLGKDNKTIVHTVGFAGIIQNYLEI